MVFAVLSRISTTAWRKSPAVTTQKVQKQAAAPGKVCKINALK
jgi:hypothetical protein